MGHMAFLECLNNLLLEKNSQLKQTNMENEAE